MSNNDPVPGDDESNYGAPLPAPPYDPELEAALAATVPEPSPMTVGDIEALRENERSLADVAVEQLRDRGVAITDIEVPTPDGDCVPMSLVYRPDRAASSPLIYYVHGGGMMLGTRWSGHDEFTEWIERYNAVVATVEYRLAPEHPYPIPQEDCYAGLVWLAENAANHGLKPATTVIAGMSAGGGLAACVALMARARGGPRLAGQMLLGPMLDDRGLTASARQFRSGLWDATENELGWQALLSGRAGSDDIPAEAAPARNADFTGLPPTLIEVGSAEVFRDECVSYASGIWKAGGQAELHVWAGGFHGFQVHVHTALSQGALDARHNWLDRILGYTGRLP